MCLGIFFLRAQLFDLLTGLEVPLTAAGLGIRNFSYVLLDGPGCSVEQVKTLEDRVQTLAFDTVKLAELTEENQVLRQTVGYVEKRGLTTVAAKIVGRSATRLNQRYLIDRGGDDGLAEGDPVIIGEGNLLGKITELSQQSAVVTGLGDYRSAVAAALLNGNKTIGIVNGTSDNRLALNFIPKDEAVAVNNLVVTSGLEEGVPSGLLIGVVTAVRADPNTPFLDAVVEPLVDFRKYQIVSVITKK